MMRIFLDSNILVYLLATLSPYHRATVTTVQRLTNQGVLLAIAPQSIYEFWVAATRPTSDGGLGYDPATARSQIHRFVQRFRLLDDSILAWSDVIDLAVTEGVLGRRIHDARLVALMRVSSPSCAFTA